MENQMIIHLGMEESSLSSQQVCTLLNCVDMVSKNLCSIFYTDLFYNISVEPFEKGSFKLPLVVKILGSTAISLAAGQFFGGFLEGLTGVPISEFGKNSGAYVQNMLVGFFTTPPENMKKYIDKAALNPNFNFDASLKARSCVYDLCLKDKRINFVSFEAQNKKKIERKQFGLFLVDDLIHELPSEEKNMEAIIYKPVNIKKKAKWAFKGTQTNSFFNATIEDDDFLNSFYDGKYPLKESKNDDVLKILVEESYRLKNGIKECTGISIKKVYAFNETKINEMPTDFSIKTKKEKNNQYDLFNQEDKS